jgi:hypothetical protein
MNTQMKQRGWSCLLAVFLLSLVAFRGEAGEAAHISGTRIRLSESPRWTTSGAWDASGEQLLLIDIIEGKILQYDPQGRRVKAVAIPEIPNPVLMQRTGSGSLWVENEDGEIFELDRELRPRRLIDLLDEVKSSRDTLISVSGWVPIGESELLVVGDLRRAQGPTGAILRVPLQHPQGFTILQEIGIDTPPHRFFLLGQPYLAAVKSAPYFLLSEDTPRLVKPGGARVRFVQVTASGQREVYGLPDLPKKVTMNTTSVLFDQLERSVSAAGLYGWRGYLYMLKRAPGSDGMTRWSLLKVDPATDKIVYNRQIDTMAHHLVVVPGDKYWAFVEKGPVKGPGNQAIPSFFRVPAEAIEAP